MKGKVKTYSLIHYRSSDESIILLRNFIDSFQQIEEDHDGNEVEGVYHRTKRNSDRGVT